jgi:hypothetical protein
MNYRHLIRSLNVTKKALKKVLEQDAEGVIDNAINSIVDSKEQYDKYQRRKDLSDKPVNDWGYSILEPPLRFKIVTYKGYKLRPDIICNFRWQKEGALPTTQELVLRVWSADEELMYREEYDSEMIGELVTAQYNPLKERVMLRCHFDLANPNQDGPLYHLQIGGNPRAEEYCSYPKEFDLPRLIHHPLDTVLLCQLVVANFFPADYQEIRRDINWRWAVKTVERYLLSEYYAQCLAVINDKKTNLIDHLWNTPAA